MIKDPELWKKFEDEFIRKDNLSIDAKFNLLEAMFEEARALGVWESEDPLEGIEVKIKIARILNALQGDSEKGRGGTRF